LLSNNSSNNAGNLKHTLRSSYAILNIILQCLQLLLGNNLEKSKYTSAITR
jgi:hypothetical protein